MGMLTRYKMEKKQLAEIIEKLEGKVTDPLQSMPYDKVMGVLKKYICEKEQLYTKYLSELESSKGDFNISLEKVMNVLEELLVFEEYDFYSFGFYPRKYYEILMSEMEKRAFHVCEDNIVEHVDSVASITGKEFEKVCAELLVKNGFQDVELTRDSGDHGIDILAFKDGITYAIQCKYYNNPVGNAAVQQAHTGCLIYDRDIAVVLTNSCFTDQAEEEARICHVKLWDGSVLERLASKEKSGEWKRIEQSYKEENINDRVSELILSYNLYGRTDIYFMDACELVIDKSFASIGTIQRNFKIGFNSAERIMNQLEEGGIVGPQEETRPRKVLVTKKEFEKMKERKGNPRSFL